MKISKIKYSSQFDDFLDSLNDKERATVITNALENYAKDPNELPRPKDCEHYANREKVAIPDADVVVYYDNFGSYWVMVDGTEFPKRAS